MNDVSRILHAINSGDALAADQLLPLVYDELRRLAAAQMAQEKPGQTLDATALVHEAYLRLVGDQHFENRRHFFACAAEAMRRILVENARRKKAQKHGGARRRVELDEADRITTVTPDEVLAVDEALAKLAGEDAPAAEIVKLRYYAGLSVEEAAQILGLSRASAYRHWTYARAWLRCAVAGPEPVEKKAPKKPSPS
jgi:RNA polymerase sigma factor (TIGR02999 family)